MIIKTLASGASGMRVHQMKLDIIGNNIANVNTSSFKKSRLNFAELVRQNLGDEGIPAANEPSPQEGSGVKMISIARIMDQGDLVNTGRELDLAIDGEGFFKVISPDDKEYYTRDGSFYINNEGVLVNANGYRLEPEVSIGTDEIYKSILVNEKGHISGILSDGKPGDLDTTIELYTFPVPANLLNKGNNLFMQTEASGEEISAEPGEDGLGYIRQGYTERSNVDLATEMIGMIEAQRAYASNAKTIQTADEMWERANNMRK